MKSETYTSHAQILPGKDMNAHQQPLAIFAAAVNESNTLWALQKNDDWVVCDSIEFEQTDVMPLWSTEEGAREYCTDAWADYQPASIPLDDFLEYWVADLNEDGVLIGLDWPPGEAPGQVEVDPILLIKALVGDTSTH